MTGGAQRCTRQQYVRRKTCGIILLLGPCVQTNYKLCWFSCRNQCVHRKMNELQYFWDLVFREPIKCNGFLAGIGVIAQKLKELQYFWDLAFRKLINYIGFLAGKGVIVEQQLRNYITFGTLRAETLEFVCFLK